jgi:crotonobetainyl-CoA:carnitine CoA-transferase CaiB-like acyl-CoA transferase
MAGPLYGVRVVEITMFQQGPVAGMRLGDLCAEVIKVEPKTGDPGRGMMRMVGVDAGLKGRMGIGPEVLLKRNPRLIYAHASGWGRNGPGAICGGW